MKRVFILITATFLLLIIITAFRNKHNNKRKDSREVVKELEQKRLTAIGCGSLIDFEEMEETYMPLLKGWGNYTFPVTTSSDSAQVYFNQGINMYYAFHIIEAMGSFKKAAAFDPGCAMAWWGQALSYGPNINDFGYSASPEALTANSKALELSASCTEREKALIHAMQVRYTADTTQSREKLNQLYVDAMKAATDKLPSDADIAALYADALMVQHPWDLYEHNGQPKPWTPLIATVLEKTLKLSPKHPGANHYYIHTVEGSLKPDRALTAARQLPGLMPGVSHIVHMPSHIYIRTGDYAEGEQVNEQALTGYDNYLQSYSPVVNAAFLYQLHNQHMQANCGILEGRYAYSLQAANECRKSIDTTYLDIPGYFGTYSQYAFMTPYFTLIRFGKWDDILKEKSMGENRSYGAVIYHFGRGLAFARKHLFDEATKELASMQRSMKDSVMLISASTFNPPIAGASVGEKILEGVIAAEKNDLRNAISFLQAAVQLEDNMMYAEPKDWPLPARHYLGDVLLKAGKSAAAEQVFRDDLKTNPKNGWALTGLEQSLIAQKKQKEAASVKPLLDKAFARADMEIKGSAL
ncbi:MAG: hypothetical protein V4722_26295 [Bacteroidota bacterium]